MSSILLSIYLFFEIYGVFLGILVMLGAFGTYALSLKLAQSSRRSTRTHTGWVTVLSMILFLFGVLLIHFQMHASKQDNYRGGIENLRKYPERKESYRIIPLTPPDPPNMSLPPEKETTP